MSFDAALETVAQAAAAARPTIHLERTIFIAHLRERVSAEDSVNDLASLHASDLYLACACLLGDPQAWRDLDREFLSRTVEYVRRIDASHELADEVRQRLAEKLLPDGRESSKLALYSGRGPLGAWMRVAAIRIARDLRRGARTATNIDDVVIAAPQNDLEVAFLKRQFATEFEAAFQEVLETLSTDERNLMRLHYLDGLTIDQVGKAYGVSRATAARQLASARATVVERVRTALSKRIDPSAAGPASVLAFIQSQLDMSLRGRLT